jgi:threonine/homoserine/homoserine lactone efflux protein
MIQMTNPKAALTWIAIISLGWAIVLGIALLSVWAHLTYAVAFSTTAMVALYGNGRRQGTALDRGRAGSVLLPCRYQAAGQPDLTSPERCSIR